MDSAEAEEYTWDEECPSYEEYANACVKFANLNLCKYAPMIDLFGQRAQGKLFVAWYNLYAYGEEADVDSLPKAVQPVYLAMRSDVLRARRGAAKRGAPDRPDTRPGRRSKPYDSGMDSGTATESVTEPLPTHSGISSGAATESATNVTNARQAADTFVPLANVVADVRSSQYKEKDKDKDKKERKEKGGNVNRPCYEVGQSYFYVPCPVCGKQVVARFDESGAAYTTDTCGQNGIELPDGCEARNGPDGYTLERTNDPRGDGEHG